MFIGAPITKDTKLVILDDVITAGTALRMVLALLKDVGSPKVQGVVVAVDRMEKGQGEKTAIQELKAEFGIDVYSIVNIDEIVEYLYNRPLDGVVHIDDEKFAKIKAYREQYGVKA
jgi:orotate phosphoribosyltransferase